MSKKLNYINSISKTVEDNEVYKELERQYNILLAKDKLNKLNEYLTKKTNKDENEQMSLKIDLDFNKYDCEVVYELLNLGVANKILSEDFDLDEIEVLVGIAKRGLQILYDYTE